MLWTDEPISDASQDTLGRREFTDAIADLIERSHDPDSSIVIGLTGPWGSGKTSAFSLAKARLQKADWSVVELNPWAAADDESLLAEFFAALTEVLPARRGAKLKKNLAACASVVGPGLSAIPGAGNAVSLYAEKLEKYLTARKPWPKAFKEASDEFRSLRQRILIFVDDCDRLDPSELRTLLKVIRLIGRFPGITYVLAYDEETMSRTLSAAGVGDKSVLSAQRYLEKIVQFIVPMPQLTTSEVLARLTDSLDPVLRESGWSPEILSEYRLARTFEDVMLRRLGTPRSIDRFVAQARNLLTHVHPAEFDAIDLLILLFARLNFPEGYAQLTCWQDTLLGSGKAGTNPWRANSGQSVDWEPLLRYAGERPEDQRDFQLALGSLFPAFQQHHLAFEEGSVRVANPLYFERHLLFGVPLGEVRDQDVWRALDAARAEPPDCSLLDSLLSPTNAKNAVAIQKLRRRTEDWVADDASLEFVLHITDLHVALQDGLESAHYGSSLLFWVASLLPLLENEVDAATLVASLRAHLGDELTAYVARRMLGPSLEGEWVKEIAERVGEMCLTSVMQQLLDGDSAPTDASIHLLVGFLRAVGRLDELVALVRGALTKNEITRDGIAARCVSVVTSYGDGSTRLDRLDGDLLQILVGDMDVPAPSTSSWPDRQDLAWSNRREWARWLLGPGRESGIPGS